MATNDSGPAFPMPSGPEPCVNDTTHYNEGMSLREYIAAKAMAGLMCFDAEPAKTAEWAVAYADALLAQLRKEQTDANPERPLA